MPSNDVRQRSRQRDALGAAGFLLAVAVAAVLGSIAASSSSEQYQQLRQPSWAPPSWLFGPTWTVLYILIAISGWLVWRTAGSFSNARTELAVYFGQLVLNAAWTPLFFAARLHGPAAIEIVVLVVAIVITTVLFFRRNRLAGVLLLPYLAWTLFATALNISIWLLNS